jgi:hypothetical protein
MPAEEAPLHSTFAASSPDQLIRQRLRVARLTLELVPGSEALAAEQLDSAAQLLNDWKAGTETTALPPPPQRAELLARAAELERLLREELSRRNPKASTPWAMLARRFWWAGVLILALAVYVGLSVMHRSFRPSDWRKPVVSGIRVDDWKQTYGPVMTGAKRRDLTVSLGGRKLGPSIFVHAVSEVKVTVLAEGGKLSGTCGYPDDMQANTVICAIKDGDRVLFESPPLNASNRQATFKVNIPPTRRLKLELRNTEMHIRMAQGVWTDLQVTR